MILTIHSPVTFLSNLDDVRDWIVQLADLREYHEADNEALRCIATAEQHAHHLLELIRRLPAVATSAFIGDAPKRGMHAAMAALDARDVR